MQTARIASAASIGLLLCQCGCFHYGYSPYGTPYGGYGPGTYPATPGSGYMGPSPTYVPYGSSSSPSPSPTPLTPNGGTQPNWQAPGSNPAPSYNGSGGSRENPVPNPTIENEPFGGGAPAEANRPAGTGAAASGVSGSGIQLQPIESGAAVPATKVVDSIDPFESPLRPTSTGTDVNAKSASLGSTASRPNPFAHDTRNYTWLRGLVDYDSQDQRWVIIYSADPDAADQYGGSITLSDHPLLQRIKPGDVVLVEGSVDAASFDHHGKPIYKVDKLQALKPKS